MNFPQAVPEIACFVIKGSTIHWRHLLSFSSRYFKKYIEMYTRKNYWNNLESTAPPVTSCPWCCATVVPSQNAHSSLEWSVVPGTQYKSWHRDLRFVFYSLLYCKLSRPKKKVKRCWGRFPVSIGLVGQFSDGTWSRLMLTVTPLLTGFHHNSTSMKGGTINTFVDCWLVCASPCCSQESSRHE